jgi:hypothetical protein
MAQLIEAGRLGQHLVRVLRLALVVDQALAPAGEQDDAGVGRGQDASIVAPRSPKHGIDPCLHAAGRVLSTRLAGVARYIATRPFETLMTL